MEVIAYPVMFESMQMHRPKNNKDAKQVIAHKLLANNTDYT